jgi:hypothetical protein
MAGFLRSTAVRGYPPAPPQHPEFHHLAHAFLILPECISLSAFLLTFLFVMGLFVTRDHASHDGIMAPNALLLGGFPLLLLSSLVANLVSLVASRAACRDPLLVFLHFAGVPADVASPHLNFASNIGRTSHLRRSLPADRCEASQADENKDETTKNFSHGSGPIWRMMAATE